MFSRFYTVALNTLIETVRQPIYGALLLATALLLILNVSLAAFTLEDDDKLLWDLGLSTLLLSGLFLSAFSASGALSKEIENKTVLTVVSKPVSRPLFVFGKLAGLVAALCLAFYLSFLVFALTVRHGVLENTSDPWDAPVLVLGIGSVLASLLTAGFCNYFYGWDFPTASLAILTPALTMATVLVAMFDKHWEPIPWGSQFVGGQIVLACYLVLLMVLMTAAVALAASTRLGQLATLVICTSFLGAGIVSDYAFGQREATSWVAAVAYRAVPNMGLFWVIDGLHAGTEETLVPLSYAGYATAYAVLWIAAILGIATAAFQTREVG